MKTTIKVIYSLTAAAVIGSLASPALAAGHQHPAKVRVIHASPDAPSVDILVNDKITLKNVSFSGISDYLEVPGANYNFKVRPAGATSPTVIDADATLASGHNYAVVATNKLEKIRPTILKKSKAPHSLHSTLRVGHFVPDAPAVNLTSLDGNILARNLTFGQTAEVQLPAGTYSLQLRLASDNSQVVTDLANLELNGGTNYTALAIGTLETNDKADFQVKFILD